MEKGKKKSKLKVIIPIVIAIVIIAVVGIIISGNNKTDDLTNDVYVEDSTTAISVKDIVKTYKDNQARFDEEYKNKKVKFTGTISEIRTNILRNGSGITTDEIIFKEGWNLHIPTEFCKLSQLNKGDKLEVITKIRSVFSNTVEVYDYGYTSTHSIKTPKNYTSIKFNGEEICIIN